MSEQPELRLFGSEHSNYFSAVSTIFASQPVSLSLNVGTEGQAVQELLDGGIGGALLPATFFAGIAPSVTTAELPFLLSGREEAHRYWDSSYREILNQEFAPHGISVLAVFDGGERHIFSRGKAVIEPEDLAHTRFRVMPQTAFGQALRSLHAVVLEIPGSDFSRAMIAGEFDACDRSISNFFEYEMEHSFEHVTLTAHSVAATILVAGQRLLESIRDRQSFLKQIIEVEKQQRLAYAITDREKLEQLRKIAQVHFPDRSRFREVFHEILVGYSPKLIWEGK